MTAHIKSYNEWTRAQVIAADLAFKKAMIEAVKAGTEKVFFGVIKDYSPIPPSVKRYDAQVISPVTMSVAGECAMYGSGVDR